MINFWPIEFQILSKFKLVNARYLEFSSQVELRVYSLWICEVISLCGQIRKPLPSLPPTQGVVVLYWNDVLYNWEHLEALGQDTSVGSKISRVHCWVYELTQLLSMHNKPIFTSLHHHYLILAKMKHGCYGVNHLLSACWVSTHVVNDDILQVLHILSFSRPATAHKGLTP